MDSHFLNLGTSWTWMVSFTLLPINPRGNNPHYSLDRRLGGPRVGLDDMQKWKFLILLGFKLRPLGRADRSQSLYRLSYPGSYRNLVKYTYSPKQGIYFIPIHCWENNVKFTDCKIVAFSFFKRSYYFWIELRDRPHVTEEFSASLFNDATSNGWLMPE
jgi:hypothetical protein